MINQKKKTVGDFPSKAHETRKAIFIIRLCSDNTIIKSQIPNGNKKVECFSLFNHSWQLINNRESCMLL